MVEDVETSGEGWIGSRERRWGLVHAAIRWVKVGRSVGCAGERDLGGRGRMEKRILRES